MICKREKGDPMSGVLVGWRMNVIVELLSVATDEVRIAGLTEAMRVVRTGSHKGGIVVKSHSV